MKLEKREITLNETDSLTDVFYMEKNLMFHYIQALDFVRAKETQNTLLNFLKNIGEDAFFIRGLMENTIEQND